MSRNLLRNKLKADARKKIEQGVATLDDFEVAETPTGDWQRKMSFVIYKLKIKVAVELTAKKKMYWGVTYRNNTRVRDRKEYTKRTEKQMYDRYKYILNYLIYESKEKYNEISKT